MNENDDERPSMDAIERYIGRVRAVVISLTGTVPAEHLDTAQHLIDHGEPAEGLRSLAWSISDNDISVPRWTLDTIRELTTDLIEPQDMPRGLWPDPS